MRYLSSFILQSSVLRPVWVLLVLLPLAVASVFGVLRINYEDGLRSVFSSESQVFQEYARHSDGFTQSEANVAVLVSAPSALDGDDLGHLQEFLLDVQFLDGIAGILSVFSLRRADQGGAAFIPLLPSELGDQGALHLALKSAARMNLTGAALVSSDLRETVVVLSIGGDPSEMVSSSKVLRNLDKLTAKFAEDSGLEVQVAGLLSVREHIIQGLRLDQMKINLLGALFGFAVSLVMFRSFWVAALNTITPIIALLFCLGAFGWFGLSINALTNALPVLILVLASSDSIHLTYEIRLRMSAGEKRIAAVRQAVIDIAPPCVLTSLTTMLAFVSLFYSESPIIRDLALSGVVGVFIAMIAVLFVHPMVFVLAGGLPLIKRALPIRHAEQGQGFTDLLAKAVTSRFRAISVLGVALCVAGLWVLLPVQTNYRFMENIDVDNSVAETLSRVEQIAGPVTTVEIPLRLKDGIGPFDAALLVDIGVLHQAVKDIAGIHSGFSLHSLRVVLSGDGELVSPEVLKAMFDKMPERFRNRLIGTDGRTLQLTLLVPDIGSQAVARFALDVEIITRNLGLTAVSVGRPTGFLVMSSALSDAMIRQLTISFLLAAIACPLLIGVWYRRLDFALAAIVPNLLPIALIGAGLTLLDFDIQLTSALALTIAFGIALDDSIHVFNRLHLQACEDPSQGMSRQAIDLAMKKVSPVLVTTTVILSSGILATLVSEMPMIRFFGVLCIVTFVLALICDLLVLPALIVSFTRKIR